MSALQRSNRETSSTPIPEPRGAASRRQGTDPAVSWRGTHGQWLSSVMGWGGGAKPLMAAPALRRRGDGRPVLRSCTQLCRTHPATGTKSAVGPLHVPVWGSELVSFQALPKRGKTPR